MSIIYEIRDFFYTLSRSLKPKRMSFKDWVVNIYLKFRWNIIRWFSNIHKNNESLEIKKGFDLTFSDYFNKVNWDRFGEDKWKIGEHWGLVHPRKLNVWYGEPLFENGKTKFICKYNPREFTINGEKHIIPFKVSLLSSAKWFRQQYGRFECRMQLPDVPHSWPAFWLWGPTWPPEIDVIEAYGRNTGKQAIYQEPQLWWGEKYGGHKSARPWMWKLGKRSDLNNRFWEFAVEWSPNKIEWFTNGIKVWKITNKKILNNYFQNGPMWIVINNSIRNYSKHDQDYWSEFEVDYIRAYQFKNK